MNCLVARESLGQRATFSGDSSWPTPRIGSEPNVPLTRKASPSTQTNHSIVASHSRAAFSATTSSTGWISVGELAMTPKISLVAVCCSKRLLEFLEQPDVLDGDDRLVGEGLEQLDLRRGEGAHLGATCAQCSNEFPLLTKGNDQKSARVAGSTHKLGNRSAHGRRECGACHARASSETVVHQY